MVARYESLKRTNEQEEGEEVNRRAIQLATGLELSIFHENSIKMGRPMVQIFESITDKEHGRIVD